MCVTCPHIYLRADNGCRWICELASTVTFHAEYHAVFALGVSIIIFEGIRRVSIYRTQREAQA